MNMLTKNNIIICFKKVNKGLFNERKIFLRKIGFFITCPIFFLIINLKSVSLKHKIMRVYMHNTYKNGEASVVTLLIKVCAAMHMRKYPCPSPFNHMLKNDIRCAADFLNRGIKLVSNRKKNIYLNKK
jgi:hypothetical protein